MSNESLEYWKLQYEEGARIIRYWIETRYKILQFVGYFNAAVLTFGFSQKVMLSADNSFAGLSICVLSVFVALMGLATEFSVASYITGYFDALRKIEADLGYADWAGILTHSRENIAGSKFHKALPVHRAHKLFYCFLITFWLIMLVYHIRL